MKLKEFKKYIHPEEDIVLRDFDDTTFEMFYRRKSDLTDKELDLKVVNCYTLLDHTDKLVIKVKGLKRCYVEFEVGDYVELYCTLFKHKIVYKDTDGYVVKNCMTDELRVVKINEIERIWGNA